jgi:hypothetical protein
MDKTTPNLVTMKSEYKSKCKKSRDLEKQ